MYVEVCIFSTSLCDPLLLLIFKASILYYSPYNKVFFIVQVRMSTLFECLDLNNVIALVVAVLTEQQIILCSSHWSALVDVAETVCALIFPFQWQGVYMPVLPQRLQEFLYAPVPFIAGIHSSYLESMDIPREVLD